MKDGSGSDTTAIAGVFAVAVAEPTVNTKLSPPEFTL
jgi:hypothetical protein